MILADMRRSGGWWTRTRGLPPAVHRSWAASLGRLPGREVRVLAWAQTGSGFAVGSRSALSFPAPDGWSHLGWHEIARGGWDAGPQRLHWTTVGGVEDSLELQRPGRLPELFRERVAASIVLERFVPLDGRRGVLVTGRRDLSATDRPIVWQATLGPGLSWSTPGVGAAADAALLRLKIEYDTGEEGW